MVLELPENSGEGIPFRLEGQLYLPGIFPSLRIHHRILLEWEGLRKLLYRCPAETGLKPRKTETRFEAKTPLRGVYRIRQAVEVTDFFTLFLFSCPGTGPETLTVYPEPEGETYRIPRPSRYSSLSTQKKENAEEFYETRKYYPGDDPRKINWKLYAHSKEMFIRVGEEGVPKLERICCLLLAGTPDKPLTVKETDRIVSRFLHEVLLLHKNSEAEVLILVPGLSGYTLVENPRQCARLLAGVKPGVRPEAADPVPERGAWTVVTPSGDPDLGEWLRKGRERGIRPSLLLWQTQSRPLTLSALLRKIVLVPAEQDPVRERKIRRFRRPPLWQEGERLTAAAGGGVHVRTV